MNNPDSKSKVVSIASARCTLYNAAVDREQNFIGKRIAEARNNNGLSLASFSRLLADYGVSVSPAAINKWELGGSTPNAYQLLAIRQALNIGDDGFFMSNAGLPELNAEGLKKVAEYKADLIASGRYKPQPKVMPFIKYIDMPVSSLTVSAGTGAFLDAGNFEMISFPESSVPDGAEFGVRVSGNSMEPVYHDGQIVWVQQCEQLAVGEVGVFIYDGDGYLKVYSEREPEEADREAFTDSYGNVHMQPVMVSYNQEYDDRPVAAYAGFQIVGRVL